MALIKGNSGPAQQRNSIMVSFGKGPAVTTPTKGQKLEQLHQGSDPDSTYGNMPSPRDWRH